MSDLSSFRERLFSLDAAGFEAFAVRVFEWQASENPLYRDYVSLRGIDPKYVKRLEDIPFLPIDFFKTHNIKTGDWSPALTFLSSGTTGQKQSRHLVDDPSFYDKVTKKIFEAVYCPLSDCHFFALLPSYLEREGSSLIHMVKSFVESSGSSVSGFYLDSTAALLEALENAKAMKGTRILWGVTFALLELAEKHTLDLSDFIIMETGGMKGRRREMIREELHDFLQRQFNAGSIHSEYGMTELFSQAYSTGGGIFRTPAWMRVMVRDINDPFTFLPPGKTGGLNVIDLANLHSCCFIETGDLGKRYGAGGEFEVLGRFDNSDVRGCNLLVQ